MWLQILLVCACVLRCDGHRFAFFKDLHVRSGSRRVFGGEPASHGEFPAACALLDHSMVTRCTGTVLTPRWVLTAAHCTSSNLAYVRFSRPSGKYSNAPVHLLYTHPDYRVLEKDEGAGMDVVLLHHDVGLVRTRRDMAVASAPTRPGLSRDPLQAMRDFETEFIHGEEVQMLGYGRSQHGGLGAELRAARLRVSTCERGRDAWRHCGCARGNALGVCAGDSGGPVMYKGRQIGVTSMGPTECSPGTLVSALSGERVQPEITNVFTSVRPYVDLINSTMYDLDRTLRMRVVETNTAHPPSSPTLYLWQVAVAILCHS